MDFSDQRLAQLASGTDKEVAALASQLLQLRQSIRQHQSQSGHAVCWQNDQQLWRSLDPAAEYPHETLPVREEFLGQCARYYESRLHGTPYEEPDTARAVAPQAAAKTSPRAPKTLFPVIVTPSVEPARDFYVAHFGFRIVFDADWYVHLHGGVGPGRPLEFALMRPGVDTQPQPLWPAFSGEGMILTIEVTDVDAVYESLRLAGALRQVILEPTDEAWGQRHFLIRDPAGILLDVVRPIAPSDEYAAAYEAEKPDHRGARDV